MNTKPDESARTPVIGACHVLSDSAIYEENGGFGSGDGGWGLGSRVWGLGTRDLGLGLGSGNVGEGDSLPGAHH